MAAKKPEDKTVKVEMYEYVYEDLKKLAKDDELSIQLELHRLVENEVYRRNCY